MNWSLIPPVFARAVFGLILGAVVLALISPVVAIWILIVPLLLLPAGLISAVLYGRGIQRTIAVGAAASAASPFLAMLLFALPMGFRGFFFFSGGGLWLLIVALAPFICAATGGVTAVLLLPRVQRRHRRRALQFKLSTLLWGMTAISVYLGLISAAPISLIALLLARGNKSA